jgi:hypothetical protein
MITASDGCDLGENLATQAMTNLAERGSFGENQHPERPAERPTDALGRG